jgi:hypothetical protein
MVIRGLNYGVTGRRRPLIYVPDGAVSACEAELLVTYYNFQ